MIITYMHANGARFYLFIHIEQGLYYRSYFTHTWIVGVFILLLVIAITFLDYVLLWGQIFFKK